MAVFCDVGILQKNYFDKLDAQSKKEGTILIAYSVFYGIRTVLICSLMKKIIFCSLMKKNIIRCGPNQREPPNTTIAPLKDPAPALCR